jgi:hypothetical protein
MSGGGNSGIPWPVWAIVTILVALITAYATLNANKPTHIPTLVPSSPSLDPTLPETEPSVNPPPRPSKVDIDWGNLNQYFEIWKVNFKAGFQEGTSELTFLVRAKGDFNGEMTATYYNADGLEVCDPICIGNGNPVSVTKSDSEFRFPSGNSYFWQKDVVFKASLLL